MQLWPGDVQFRICAAPSAKNAAQCERWDTNCLTARQLPRGSQINHDSDHDCARAGLQAGLETAYV